MSSNHQPCPFAMAKIKLYLLSSMLLMFVSFIAIGGLLAIVLSETVDDAMFSKIVNLMVFFTISAFLSIFVFIFAIRAIRYSFDEDNPAIRKMGTALLFQLAAFVSSIIGIIPAYLY